ncbi:heterokaryon incompatibility protein-domain-containing protein [Hyaloscypha sp. PMI_1271]|nr:heterokaryon incompatibility protein-domain-containing protein [Hyaloscypha sp. PMI_1271]
MSGTTYHHLDNASSEIRLLKLHKSPLQYRKLSCTLVQVPLAQAPKYQALSYVWGDPSDKIFITVNCADFGVTRNLYTALLRLRRRFRDVVVWIDAVCINQSDVAERNEQVLKMRDIYNKAAPTIAWLGEDGDGLIRIAFKIIKAFAHILEKYDELTIPYTTYVELVVLFYPQLFEANTWMALERLFDRPWWHRAWVYQEFVISHQVVLMCGKATLDWRKLKTACVVWEPLLDAYNYCHLPKETVMLIRAVLETFDKDMIIQRSHLFPVIANDSHSDAIPVLNNDTWEDVYQLRLASNGLGSSAADLEELVIANTRRKCTDSKDAIYAFAGVDQNQKIIVDIDYSRSTEFVFADFVKCVATQKRSLNLLSITGVGVPGRRHMNLPSWVPDFNPTDIDKNWYFRYNQRLYSFARDSSHIERTLVSPEARFSDDLSTLTTQAIKIDTVVGLTSPYQGEILEKIWEEWASFAERHYASNSAGGIPWRQAFLRTCIGDCREQMLSTLERLGVNPITPNPRKDFMSVATGFFYMGSNGMMAQDLSEASFLYRRMLATWVDPHQNGDANDVLTRDFLGPPNTFAHRNWDFNYNPNFTELEGNLKVFLTEWMQAANERRLIATTNGHICLCPTSTKVGDIVCSVPGCQIPIVIRKAGRNFVVVGPCISCGLMNWEAFNMIDDGKASLEELTFV